MRDNTMIPVTACFGRWFPALLVAGVSLLGLSSYASQINIAEQDLATAIQQLAHQSGAQIVFSSEIVAGHTSVPVIGEYDAEQALKILLGASGDTFERSPSGSLIIIRPVGLQKAAMSTQMEQQSASAPATRSIGQPASTGLDEIVVTARRKEEQLQAVPVGIEALSGAKLQTLGIQQISDLNKISAGLAVVGTGNAVTGQTAYSIRGEGAANGGGLALTGVVTYFDDVAVYAGILPLFDLDNIQVVKGPQGVAFGKATTSGAVLFVTKKPVNEFGGYVDLKYGNYNDHEFEGALNIPVVDDKFLLRIAGQGRFRDGYVYDTGNHTWGGGVDFISGRVTGLVRPTDDIQNTIEMTFTYNETHGDTEHIVELYPPNIYNSSQVSVKSIAAMPAAIASYYGFAPGTTWYQALQYYWAAAQKVGPYVVNEGGPATQLTNHFGIINTTTYDLPFYDITFKNIFSATYLDSHGGGLFSGIFNGSPLPIVGAGNPWGGHTGAYRISDEAQLLGKLFDDKMRYIVGGYWQDNWNPLMVQGVITLGNTTYTPLKSGNSTHAGFIDLNYDVTDTVSLEAGARYFWDNSNQDSGATCTYAFPVAFLTPAGCTNPLTKHTTYEDQVASSSFSINWTPQAGLMFYAATRKSYLQGGLNSVSSLPQFAEYNPQLAQDIESGVKWDWDFDGVKGRTDADVFHVWYTNMQVKVIQSSLNNGVLVSGTVIENNAAAEVSGIEWQQTVVPSPWFDVTFNATWQQGGYDYWNDPVQGNFKDTPLVGFPRWKVNFVPTVHILPLDRFGGVTFSANINYTAKFDGADGQNIGHPEFFQNGNTLIDMRLDWKVMDTGVTASVACTNCMDRRYRSISANAVNTGMLPFSYAAPRMYYGELKYRF